MKPSHFESIVDRQRSGSASLPKDPMERLKVLLNWGLAALFFPGYLIVQMSIDGGQFTLHAGNIYLWGDADGSVPIFNSAFAGPGLVWSTHAIVNAYPQRRPVFVKIALLCALVMVGMVAGLYALRMFVESVYVLPLIIFNVVGVIAALPHPPFRWIRDFGAPNVDESLKDDHPTGRMLITFICYALLGYYIYTQLMDHGLSVLSYPLSLWLGWCVGRCLFLRPN